MDWRLILIGIQTIVIIANVVGFAVIRSNDLKHVSLDLNEIKNNINEIDKKVDKISEKVAKIEGRLEK